MNHEPFSIYLLSDKKNYYIRPCVCGKDGIGRFSHTTEKLNYSCTPLELGNALFRGFDYISDTCKNNEEADISDNSSKIPWRKSGNILVKKYENGAYKLSLQYYNHEIMSPDIFEDREYSINISAEELGKAVSAAMKQCFDYALSFL